ncbi:MAG: pyridoxal phosphate-dependent decarboxylase family protein [Nannocystaceae bacterium]|nr:pyridoxal-dependent decarboxylase [bacterium]
MTSLEPTRPEVEAWLDAVSRQVLDHIERLAEIPSVGAAGGMVLGDVSSHSLPIPETPTRGFDALLKHVMRAAELSINAAGPGYLAYIPGGGLLTAGVADLIANWVNRYTGVNAAAPAFCRLEADVIAWLATQFGYGPSARGLLTSGGSLANFSAIVAARHRKLGSDGDYRDARVYTSTQAHHSVAKSVSLAGIPAKNVVAVPTDDRLRLRPDAFEDMLVRDAGARLRPFLLVSAAGTTNTGAVDPLAALSDVCERHGVWHHVDGAYGGAFALCETGRARLQGIDRADSVTFDPHKGMFLPYGTGCLLVRDGDALRAAHRADAPYLQDFRDDAGLPPSPTEYGPELSRDFRGLRVWLSLQLHGAAAFRAALEEKLQLAQTLAAAIRALPSLELVDEPQLSVVPFRPRRRENEPLEAWSARTAALCKAINERGNVYMSTTRLPHPEGDVVTVRPCVLSFRTHTEQIAMAIDDITAAAGC